MTQNRKHQKLRMKATRMLVASLSGTNCRFGVSWGPFLESPGNLTGPESYFWIKVSRKVGCVLSSNEVHFVSLANDSTV